MASVQEQWSGGRIRVEITADSREEAEQARERYLNSYHPLGYDTFMGRIRDEGGRFVVSGDRSYTCD